MPYLFSNISTYLRQNVDMWTLSHRFQRNPQTSLLSNYRKDRPMYIIERIIREPEAIQAINPSLITS